MAAYSGSTLRGSAGILMRMTIEADPATLDILDHS
jgi:hypothetical protein